jgi:integrase
MLDKPGNRADLTEAMQRYMRASRAENTWRAYAEQWQRFEAWCRPRTIAALPAEPVTVAQYLAHSAQKGAAVASINVMIAAIAFRHRAAGLVFDRADPVLAAVVDGIRRQHVRPQRQAEPLTGQLLGEILARVEPGPADLRDAALLSLLYLFALRASEAVGLDWMRLVSGNGWCAIGAEKAQVVLMQSKGSQRGAQSVTIPTQATPRALRAIQAWVAHADIEPGEPLLRALTRGGGIGRNRMHVASVGVLVKRAIVRHLTRIGTPSHQAAVTARRFCGHSGRVGLYVSATEGRRTGPAPGRSREAQNDGDGAALRRERAQMLRNVGV